MFPSYHIRGIYFDKIVLKTTAMVERTVYQIKNGIFFFRNKNQNFISYSCTWRCRDNKFETFVKWKFQLEYETQSENESALKVGLEND